MSEVTYLSLTDYRLIPYIGDDVEYFRDQIFTESSIDTSGVSPAMNLSRGRNVHAYVRSLYVILLIAGYTVVIWHHVPRVHHARNLVNPDALSYIGISERYAVLDLSNAINGYWAPLASWLLTVPAMLGFDLVISFHVLNGIVAWLCIGSLCIIARRIGFNILTSLAVGLGSSVPITAWSIVSLTPDLLFVLMVLLSLLAVMRFVASPTRPNALLLGLSGSFIYFSKGFGLPVFLLAIIGAAVAHCLALGKLDKERINHRTAISFALGFVAPSATWIALLSIKYGELMYSSSGNQNLWAIGPKPTRKSTQLPDVEFNGPINFWFDPTRRDLFHWSPVQSWGDFTYWLDIVAKNLLDVYDVLGPIYLIALFVGGVVAVRGQVGDKAEAGVMPASFVWVFLAAQPMFYSFIAVEKRYLWVAFLFSFVSLLFVNKPAIKLWSPMICAIGLVITPAIVWSADVPPKRIEVFRDFDGFPAVPSARYRITGTEIAPLTCGSHSAANSRGSETMYIAYYGDSAYHGVTKVGESDIAQTRHRLDELHITTFFLWDWYEPELPMELSGFNPIWQSNDGRLLVLQRENPAPSQEWLGPKCERAAE